MVENNILDITHNNLVLQVFTFEKEIKEQKEKNNYFFMNDNWILGYISGFCQTLFQAQTEPTFNFQDFVLNTFVATKFIEANDNDFKFLHTTLRKLTKENSDSFFVKGFKNGVDDVMSVAKDKKYPTTLFEYLSNIFNKNKK